MDPHDRLGDIRLGGVVTLFAMLRWSLRLDKEFLFAVSGIPLNERLRLVICKYLFFLRDRLKQSDSPRKAFAFGRRYLYNDRYGLGSLQRVYCSSWQLKGIVPDHPVVIDVGANLGQFNLFCRQYLGAERVISIEPVPSSYRLLTENAEEPYDCLNALVTEAERETTFYVARDSQLSSTVRDDTACCHEAITLHGTPLDRLLEGMRLDRIDLLKIDTEGSELEVLRSAEKTLEKTGAVLVEMSIFRKSTGNIFAVGSFLESHGFRLHELVFAEGSHPADADGIFIRV
jgi:FkbM family methyltransferase